MIVVRSIFQLQFGRAREALALMREGVEIQRRLGTRPMRVLTDLTGDFYTLVLEMEFDSLAHLETQLARSFADPEWKSWYARLVPLVSSGRREIFSVVDLAAQPAAPTRQPEPVVMPS